MSVGPGPVPCPCSWLDKAKALSLMIGSITAAVASITAAMLGAINHGKISDVKEAQTVQVERADEVRGVLDEQTKKTDQKLGQIANTTESTRAAVTDTLGPQLYSTWKYLENLAYESGKAEDLAKAKEAKKVYDDYMKKIKK